MAQSADIQTSGRSLMPAAPASPATTAQGDLSPDTIRLDISTVCQLRCPACSTAKGIIGRDLGSGFLRRDTFERFLSENPGVRALELSNWGEIFLNPDLIPIMELAAEHKVALHADNGVNLNHVPPAALEALVRLGFRSLTCSIDGASPETYASYRVRGDFDTVIANVRALNAHKIRLGSELPRLRWQFVIFGHNEHEIPAARRLAAELGMEIWFKLSWDGSGPPSAAFSPLRDPAWVKATTGLDHTSRRDHQQATGLPYDPERICSQLWEKPQINWDGRVLGCCVNHWADFGNAFERGLDNIFHGELMRYARRMLTGEAPPRADIPCTRCGRYQALRSAGVWLDPATHNPERRDSPLLAARRLLVSPRRCLHFARHPRAAVRSLLRLLDRRPAITPGVAAPKAR